MDSSPPQYLLLGKLTRQYLLTPSGRALLDVPGGNLLYTAVGLALWQERAGLLARVGEDYPRAWLDQFAQQGFSTQGVNVLPEAIDLREFLAYDDLHTRSLEDPFAEFAKREMEFPRSLMGYTSSEEELDSRTEMAPLSLRQTDLPEEYLYTNAAHLCPLDYLTHSLMPAVLRQAGLTTITLDPSRGYMNKAFWEDIPAILTGLTAFMPSESEVRELFRGRSDDLWEMAEALAAYGVEFIIIKRGLAGQLLYIAADRSRWEIPTYPAREADLTGAGDSFCGGFLAGYRHTYDPLQAALFGNVSASLVIEGSGVFFALDTLPGLPRARLETLREAVRKI